MAKKQVFTLQPLILKRNQRKRQLNLPNQVEELHAVHVASSFIETLNTCLVNYCISLVKLRLMIYIVKFTGHLTLKRVWSLIQRLNMVASKLGLLCDGSVWNQGFASLLVGFVFIFDFLVGLKISSSFNLLSWWYG